MSEPVPKPAQGADFGALLVPVPMRTAGERIAERLVTAIALGEFEPGQRLPTERELAATLEVSRTTVREALQRLQAAGYVTTRRGRGGGTFIQTGAGPGSDEMIKRTLDPAWEELTELLDYRRLIEQQIARTAASGGPPPTSRSSGGAVGEYAHATGRDAPGWRTTPCTRRSPGPPTTPAWSACRRGSAGRSAWASTPSRTRPRCAAARCGSIPPSPRPSSTGDPDRAARLADSHFSLTDDTLTELRARLHLRTGGDNDARSHGQ